MPDERMRHFYAEGLRDHLAFWQGGDSRRPPGMSKEEAAYFVLENAGMLGLFDSAHPLIQQLHARSDKARLVLSGCSFVLGSCLAARFGSLLAEKSPSEDDLWQVEALLLRRVAMDVALDIANFIIGNKRERYNRFKGMRPDGDREDIDDPTQALTAAERVSSEVDKVLMTRPDIISESVWPSLDLPGPEPEWLTRARLNGRWLQQSSPALIEAVPALIAALEGAESKVRSGAAQALGWLGSVAAPAVPALIAAYKDADPFVRRSAVGAISQIRAVPGLLVALREEDEEVRQTAAKALGQWGRGGASSVIPALIGALNDTSEGVQEAVVAALLQLKEDVVPALIDALKSADEEICFHAARVLGLLGPKATPAVPALVIALKDNSERVRRRAVLALGQLGEAASIAVHDLALALKDRNSEVRSYAAASLGKLGPGAGPAVLNLVDSLRDTDKFVRQRAAEALGQVGEAAGPAIPALIAVLSDAEAPVRQKSVEALCRLGRTGAVTSVLPALIAAIKDADTEGRQSAVEAVANLGSHYASMKEGSAESNDQDASTDPPEPPLR